MKIYKSKIINIVVLFIVTALVLYFSLKDNFFEIINQILTMNPLFFILAIVFLFIYYIFNSYIMKLFVNKVNKKYTFKSSFRLQLMTQFFNAITPFSSGGQPFQVYYLRKDGVRITDSTNILIQNFITYQLALIILGTVAIISNKFFNIFPEVGVLKKLVLIGYLVNAIVVFVLFFVSFNKKSDKAIIKFIIKILNKLKIVKNEEDALKKWDNYINDFHKGANKLFDDKKLFIKAIVLNILSLISLYIIPLIILFGFNDFTSMNGAVTIVASAYVMLIGAFVPIPGATGGIEYSFIAFYGNFIKGSTLNAVMLLWRLITYYFGMIIGAIVINIKERK